MAGNKRPKRRYNPERNKHPAAIRVSRESAVRVFLPVSRALHSLRDEVTLVDDVPMAEDWNGDLVPMAPLLTSWSEWFENIGVDCAAMNSLAAKLVSGEDVYERDVVAAEKVLHMQLEKFVSMRVEDLRSKVTTYQIANEFRRIGLR